MAALEPWIGSRTVQFRELWVILDADLVALYGAQTQVLVLAVKRHRPRFPADFIFQLRPVLDRRRELMTPPDAPMRRCADAPRWIDERGEEGMTILYTPILRLRARTWRAHFGQMGGLFMLATFLLTFVHGGERRAPLDWLCFALFAGALAAKEMADFPGTWARTHGAWSDAQNSPVRRAQALAELFPAEIRGWFASFFVLQKGCLLKVLGRQSPVLHRPEGHGYLRRSGYSSLMPLLVINLLVDVPLSFLLFPHLGLSVAARHGFEAAAVALHLLLITSLVGDKYWMGAGQHFVTEEQLQIVLGARASGAIQRDAIQSAQKISGPLYRRKPRGGDAIVTPWAEPNVELILRADAHVVLRRLGAETFPLRRIFLFVDRPDDLLSQLGCIAEL